MRFSYIILACLSLHSAIIYAAPGIHYDLIGERYHNPKIFTQGLEIHQDKFYESSGLYNLSNWLIYPINFSESKWAQMTTKPEYIFKLPKRYFAEGMTVFNGKIFVLTWNEKKLFVFDSETKKQLKSITYQGEGWGLTHDDQHLIRSDGSSTLYFHNAESFAIEKIIQVKDKDQLLDQLNELEYVNGFIWANIWYKNNIIKIDPKTGNVIGEMDLTELAKGQFDNEEKVLNGIAWDEKRQAFWVTGKWWKKMFLIKVK